MLSSIFFYKCLHLKNQCCWSGSGSRLDPYSATLWIRIYKSQKLQDWRQKIPHSETQLTKTTFRCHYFPIVFETDVLREFSPLYNYHFKKFEIDNIALRSGSKFNVFGSTALRKNTRPACRAQCMCITLLCTCRVHPDGGSDHVLQPGEGQGRHAQVRHGDHRGPTQTQGMKYFL